MAHLKFYEIDASYIEHLLNVDNRVPKVDYSAASAHNKFLCGIVLNVGGNDYFAPISSFKPPQRTNIIIKNSHNEAVTSKKDPLMVKNCCDFKALEKACDEYSATPKANYSEGH